MKSYFLFIFFLLCNFLAYSQELKIEVLNIDSAQRPSEFKIEVVKVEEDNIPSRAIRINSDRTDFRNSEIISILKSQDTIAYDYQEELITEEIRLIPSKFPHNSISKIE